MRCGECKKWEISGDIKPTWGRCLSLVGEKLEIMRCVGGIDEDETVTCCSRFDFFCGYFEAQHEEAVQQKMNDSKPEADPDGISQHDLGAKLDAGKIMAGVLDDFSLALMAVAEVGTFGAKKYSRGGWQDVANWDDRYKDALWRHLLKERHEALDVDSGLLHEAHLAWNALARLELKLRESASAEPPIDEPVEEKIAIHLCARCYKPIPDDWSFCGCGWRNPRAGRGKGVE